MIPTSAVTASEVHQLDAALHELADGSRLWAELPVVARAELLGQLHKSVAAQADQWVNAAIAAKKLDPDSPAVGEEWMSGPYSVLTALLVLRRSLTAVAQGRSPIASQHFGSAPGNRLTVPVLPGNAYEAVLLHGFSAEVWMTPGLSAAEIRATAGLGQLTPRQSNGVGLVLGAGNITSIGPLDVLYELFAHNRVSILKLNPTMDALLEPFSAALAPLINLGLLRIVTGGSELGAYLTQHPQVSHVHITGSAASHDAIVWGGAERSTPLLTKPITSELGGVSPIIILPGRWSRADLKYQAEHVATQRLHNGGYNCIAGQVVVLSHEWPQRSAFIKELRIALAGAPDRLPWYPGSDSRVARAQSDYPRAEKIGTRLLVTIRGGENARALQSTEYFSPVLGVIELEGTGRDFLGRAVATVNRDFIGTLGANIIARPSTIRALGAAFNTALASLNYGTIAVNAWTGVGFLTAAAPWGAAPGHTIENVGSGIGIVHNALLLAGAEKTVVRGPFRPFPRSIVHGEFALFPTPPWFVSARSSQNTGRLLARFSANPRWGALPGIFLSAFRA